VCSDSPLEARTVRRVALGAGDWQGERLFARTLHRLRILDGRSAAVDSDRRAEPTQIDFAAWLAARHAPKD